MQECEEMAERNKNDSDMDHELFELDSCSSSSIISMPGKKFGQTNNKENAQEHQDGIDFSATKAYKLSLTELERQMFQEEMSSGDDRGTDLDESISTRPNKQKVVSSALQRR